MLPPIPSPDAHDCPNCGALINKAKLKHCPHCGAALSSLARLSLATIIGAVLLGIVCVPMGACSVIFAGAALTEPDSHGMKSFIITVAAVCLVLAGLGMVAMVKMLRKK